MTIAKDMEFLGDLENHLFPHTVPIKVIGVRPFTLYNLPVGMSDLLSAAFVSLNVRIRLILQQLNNNSLGILLVV